MNRFMCYTIAVVAAMFATSTAFAQQQNCYALIYAGTCDSMQPQPGEAWWVMIPGESLPSRVLFRYDLVCDGKKYLTIYVLCDGRIFQAVPAHGDIGYTIGLIGNVPGGVNSTMTQDVVADIQPWGLHVVITLLKGAGNPVVRIEYPYPNHETETGYPAQVSYY